MKFIDGTIRDVDESELIPAMAKGAIFSSRRDFIRKSTLAPVTLGRGLAKRGT